MAYKNRNILNIVRARQNGKPGIYGQNSVACFAEDVAASSIIDNKACTLPGSLRATFLVVFSHDQTLMASSHGNHCIYVTRISTAQCIQTLEGHPRTPWCVTFHPTSNEILASGCLGGEVRVWDLQGSSEVWISEHCTMIASLAFHPHDQVLAIATDNQILLWDWRQPEPFASVKTTSPLEKVRLVRFDPLGHFMLTGITNVNEDDTEVDVDIATPRESMVSGDHAGSSSRPPVNPDSYPNPSQPEPPPPPPPPPLRIPTLHYGTRRQLPLGSSSSTSSSSASTSSSSASTPSAVARPVSPDQESRITDAQDYAAAVTLSALGLRRVSSRQYRAQRENDANRMRGRRSFMSFEEARYAHGGGGTDSSSNVGSTGQESEASSTSADQPINPPDTYVPGVSQHRYAHLHHYIGSTLANNRPDRNRNEHNSEEPSPSHSREDPGSSRSSISDSVSLAQQDRTQRGDSGSISDGPSIAVTITLPTDSDTGMLPTDGVALPADSNSNTQSNNANIAAADTSAANSTTQLSPRSIRRPRFVRSNSSSSVAANSSFEFYRRRRRLLVSNTPTNYEGSSTSSPSGNTSLRQQPMSDTQVSRALDMQSRLLNVQRQHRSAWEAGHASHWRRIETRHTINPDIGAAHTAHLGRVPDTSPPPPTSRGGGVSSTQSETPGTSVVTRAEGSSVEAEVAERSRPTLLMASPNPSVPSATIAPALPTSSYSARRTIPALIHHGHARRHMYHMGQDRPLRRERDESGSPGGPETRRARLSRYGFSRTSLGRRTSQAALHRHYARHSSIFDEENRPPSSSIHHYINRAIANAFAGRGETAVANNIGNTTYRLQWWDFQDFQLPDISRAETNVVVPNCKLHNDGSCDISQDGSLLAVFVPSPLGFPDDGVLAIYSLKQHNFGDAMYTKSFGPNAITVSLSPLGGYVMVGLAARKIHWHMSTKQLMAQIFRLAKPGTEDSLVHVMDVKHPNESNRSQISVNIAKWLPQPGRGFVYGTNRGHLRICTPKYMVFSEGDETAAGDGDSQSSDDDMYNSRNMNVHRRRSYQELRSLAMRLQPFSASSSVGGSASSSGRSAPERNARGTQTARRILFSIATQTDDVSTNNTSAQSTTNSERGQGSGNIATTSGESEMTEVGSTSMPSTSNAALQAGNAEQNRTDNSAPSTSRDSSTQIVQQNVASTSSNTAGNDSVQSSEGSVQHVDHSNSTSV